MAQENDLTGRRFWELTVITKHTEKVHKEEAWVCECSCGNKTIATKGQLLRGTKKSCGCLRKKSPGNVLDLTGKKIGKIKVIERAGKTENDNSLWLCQCFCGNTFIAMGTSLRRGDTVSCGCSQDEQIKNARKTLLEEKSIDGVLVPLLSKKVRSDSGTGHKGVHKRVRKGKESYEASITVKGKRKYLGTFKNINDAITARQQAEKEYYEPYIKALEEKENDQRNR